MTALQTRLYKQYNAMDALVSQLTNTSSGLMSQLDSLPGLVKNPADSHPADSFLMKKSTVGLKAPTKPADSLNIETTVHEGLQNESDGGDESVQTSERVVSSV